MFSTMTTVVWLVASTTWRSEVVTATVKASSCSKTASSKMETFEHLLALLVEPEGKVSFEKVAR